MSHFFPEQKLENFTKLDFNIINDNEVKINKKKLIMLLFNNNSIISNELKEILESLSKDVVGIEFGTCDDKEISDLITLFFKLPNEIPVIVLFKDGDIKDYYNGVYSKYNLLDYSVKSICKY
jgi:hypothetical protein